MFNYFNLLSRTIVAGLFLTFAGIAFADENLNQPLPAPVGRVVWVKGTFKAIMPNKEERILQKTSVIYEHDELITDVNTQAQIVFTDNTLMTFRPETKFYINSYAYSKVENKTTHSAGKYIMDLFEGGFRTITGLIAKSNPSDYRVNTPVATIGVRGTDYTVYIHHGEIYIGYYEGSPCISGTSKEELCLTPNKPYAYIPQGASAPVPLNEQPAVFQEKLEITPTKISMFTSPGQVIQPTRMPSGPITNFCITQ